MQKALEDIEKNWTEEEIDNGLSAIYDKEYADYMIETGDEKIAQVVLDQNYQNAILFINESK